MAPQEVIIVNRKAVRQLAQGHPWIYRSDIVHLPDVAAGPVGVVAENGRSQGIALLSARSKITLRMLDSGAPATLGNAMDAWVRKQLEQALQRRRRLLPKADGLRLVHGEADFLPGVFVDRYGDCLALQTSCAGADTLIEPLTKHLVDLCRPRALVLRNDIAGRAKEGLQNDVRVLVGDVADAVVASYHEGDLQYAVDLLGDQKTGGFLDQAQNHVRAAAYAQGETLDCFTYHGGFALQMAARGAQVTAYDISEAALARARDNAARCGIENVDFCLGNVFEVLPALAAAKRRFDTIVLDPPAFASTQRTTDAAWRAYKEINLRAMRLLRPNSILVSCSCSGRVTQEMFDAVLLAAAQDARRRVHVVQRWSAGPDHPVLGNVPETDYLKCRVLMVV